MNEGNKIFFDDYQTWQRGFVHENIDDCTLLYPTLKLNGEAGEIAEKVGKLWRDRNLTDTREMGPETRMEILKEIGDVLWYCSELAFRLGFKLSDVAAANIEKLESRRERGTLLGSGDNR